MWKIERVELVAYCELDKPIVHNGKVYQNCYRDGDGDVILKDNINGLHIINRVFTDDLTYDECLMDAFPNHPMNSIQQIKYGVLILDGRTLELQKLIDLFYEQNPLSLKLKSE